MAANAEIPIRVLIIEDTDDDKELVLRQLKKGGYKPEYDCIETREELVYALDKQTWDIILCDYSMPKFDGLAALQMVAEKGVDIPFILISGTVGEDVAVEAMKAGAQDYLMKDSLIRLVPVVKRELTEAKIRKEKKLADEEIRNQNAVLDALINNSHSIIIFMLDHEYHYLGFNENHRKEMKTLYNADIEVGMNMLDLITISDIKKKVKASVDKVLTGESFIETAIQSNLNIYYELHWNAVRIENNVIGVSCFNIDITERKQGEQSLAESEKLLRHTQQLTKMGGWKWNVKDQTMFWTDETYRIHGIEPGEIEKGKSDHVRIGAECYSEKDREIIFKAFGKCMNDGIPYDLEFPFTTLKGSEIWVQTTARAEKENGEVVEVIGSIMDITERKRAELELIKTKEIVEGSEAKYSRMVDNMNSGVAIYEPINDGEDFKIIDFNKAAEQIANVSAKEVMGKSLLQKFPNMTKGPFFKALQDVYQSGIDLHIPPFYYKDMQREGWRDNYIYKLPSGEIVAIFDDVSERKNAEQEILLAKDRAEESDRLKSAFLANMSHEIRTPMNGILGFSNLLKEPELTGEQQLDYIGIIEKSGNRMLNILNEIIDISKIEAGLMKTDIKELNVNKQMEYVHSFFKPEAEIKDIQLMLKVALPHKDAVILSDTEKVNAVLFNLVKNAIKYTDKGTIEFGYHKKEKFLEFYVKDTGIGIREDRQDAIFERFMQADISDVQARQGAGLGLAISKAYIEMLGGQMWVESELGLGSTFYFNLPYNVSTQQEITNESNNNKLASEKPLKKLKFLIAEDDETSEMLISIVISPLSKEVLKARTGKETIELCRSNPDIDIILMDIQMPNLNGYEATQQIRKFNSNVVIIAQTAFGLTGDREKSIESGCNDHISKPINKDKLLTLIQKYFKK
jgi:PAS domain S-box-containing protein